MSTSKTTMLKNSQFKRRTKFSHKPLVRAVNPSEVVPRGTARKGVVNASAKGSNVQVLALATETVLRIQTMINE